MQGQQSPFRALACDYGFVITEPLISTVWLELSGFFPGAHVGFP